MTSEKALKDLRRLTNDVQAAVGDPDIVWPASRTRGVEAFRLHRESRVAVLRACIDPGEPFPRHFHQEDEILVCYSGKLLWKIHDIPPNENDPELTAEDMDGAIEPGEVLRIEADTPHSVMAEGGECWVIAITIPAAEEF